MTEIIAPSDRWPQNIASADIPANNNARRFDLSQVPIISASETTQPTLSSPADDGSAYIIPAGATGSQWSTFFEGDIAIFYGGTFTSFSPLVGMRKYIQDEDENWQFKGSGGWEVESGGGGGGMTNPMTTAGDLIIGGVAGAPTRLAAGSTSGHVLTSNGSGSAPSYQAVAGGGTPAGANTNVQYNNSGAFGAEAAFSYNASTNTLTVDNITTVGLILTAATSTANAGLRLPHGTAPTSPTNGDVWTTSAGLYVRINSVTVGPLAAAGGGSLTNWTEGVNTSTPNATVAVVYFEAVNAASNVDAALMPKGTGAILAQIPDNLSAGGNKRGAGAVDFQRQRTNNTRVASGTRACIPGGQENIASGTESFAAGNSNTASGAQSFSFGSSNSSTGDRSVSLGGQSGVAGGADAVSIGGGQANAVESFSYGTAGHARAVIGMHSKAQTGAQPRQSLTLFGSTTSATPVVLASNASAASVNNQMSLGSGVNNQGFICSGLIVARHTGSGRTKSWKFDAHLNSVGGAVALVGTVTPAIIQDPGPETWTVAVTASNTTKSLVVTVTGEASTTIRWSCIIDGVEVSGF